MSARLKVLSPVKGADGRTYWHRLGSAFVNNDGSINLYLDALPVNGKLQVRAEEERVTVEATAEVKL